MTSETSPKIPAKELLQFLSLINCATRQQLMDQIAQCWQENRGFSVATLNLDHIVKLRTSPSFRDAYARQSYVVADGNPIVWLRRLTGNPVELVPGSELIAPAASLAAQLGVPVALLGSTEQTLALASERLMATHPGLQVVTTLAPEQGFDPTSDTAAAMLKQVADSGARLCFIALGAPKQELLAARAGDIAPQCGFLSIGAGLDFIAGTQTRAPRWVQKIAMEWFWRMMTNPARLARRYWDCYLVLLSMIWPALRANKG